jgi:hypothetical protein
MTAAKYDVLGIGNAIFDVLVQTDEGFLSRHGMAKGSMSLIDEGRAAAVYNDMGSAPPASASRPSPPAVVRPPAARTFW